LELYNLIFVLRRTRCYDCTESRKWTKMIYTTSWLWIHNMKIPVS